MEEDMRLIILTLGTYILQHIGFEFDWTQLVWCAALTLYAIFYDLVKP
jgi:hypothetical protein